MATIVMIDAKNIAQSSFSGVWGWSKEALEEVDYTNFKALLCMIQVVTSCLRRWHPDEIVLMSDRRCTARYELLPSYKGKRERNPEREEHIRSCLDFLRLIFPIRWVEKEGYEADDLMARFAERHHADHQVVCMTNDRDLVQVVQAFPSVVMYDHIKKKAIDLSEYDYPMVEMKTIIGCPGDNIPSVTGEVTARKLISGEMNLESYLDGGLTRSAEKLPRRVVYERNRRMVSLIGPHAILPPPDSFGFEILSPLRFSTSKAFRALSMIFPDHEQFRYVDDIIQTWGAWLGARAVKNDGLGVVDKENWKTTIHG